MPVSFRQIAAKEATIKFTYDHDFVVTLTYYPNKLTPKMAAEAQTGSAKDVEFFTQIIKSWDVMDDTVDPPVMFPLSRIDEIGADFMGALAQAMIDDMRPEARVPHLNGRS